MGLLGVLSRLGTAQHYRLYSRVVAVLREKPIDAQVKLKGWVKALRKQKERTFLDLDDGTCVKRLQVVIPSLLHSPGLAFHAAVEVEGVVRLSTHPMQEVELLAEKVKVVSSVVEVAKYPFKARHPQPPQATRDQPHLRPRISAFAAMLRVRSQAKLAIHHHLDKEGFTCVDAPILTTNDCEGGGEAFCVQHSSNNNNNNNSNNNASYFGQPAHLSVSGQLHLEAAASGLSRVYTFNPAFRAENSHTRRHLAEFWMVELEEAFVEGVEGLELLAGRVEQLVKACVQQVVEQCKEEVELHWKDCEGRENLIHRCLHQPFTHMTYQEAAQTLSTHAHDLPPLPPHGDLTRAHELFLTSHAGGQPVVVTQWPRKAKPFYMATMEGQPDVALAFDLLLPDVGEVAGGGVREASSTALLPRLTPQTREELGWYVDLRGLGGAAPTGGFGLGFERLVQFILGVKNIKDVVCFPRWAGSCVC